METHDCTCNETSIEKCDIFEFMASYVGLTVLHPGGFESTRKLLHMCLLDSSKKVLDIACGKGTSSILIAKKYGCKVVGIDINPDLINEAKKMSSRRRVDHLIEFHVGDATHLPFFDSEFDVTIAQAMLVLIDNQESVVSEALRVLKPEGRSGWIELTWQKNPTDHFMHQVSNLICAYCMLKVKLAVDWDKMFLRVGACDLKTNVYAMLFDGFSGMVKDEGFTNSVRVTYKYLTNQKIRERMNSMNRFFKLHEDIFGYGIYTMSKNTGSK